MKHRLFAVIRPEIGLAETPVTAFSTELNSAYLLFMEKSKQYPPSEYHNHSTKELLEVINTTKFSTIVCCDYPEIDAVFAPLFVSKQLQDRVIADDK